MKRIIIIGLFWFGVNFVIAQQQHNTPASYQETLTKKDLIGTWRVVFVSSYLDDKSRTCVEPFPIYYTFMKNGDLSIKEKDQVYIGTWCFAESNQLALTFTDAIQILEVEFYKSRWLLLRNEDKGMHFKKVAR